ncbi:unnamed protein product, partial [Mesorhabditis spiculigera]
MPSMRIVLMVVLLLLVVPQPIIADEGNETNNSKMLPTGSTTNDPKTTLLPEKSPPPQVQGDSTPSPSPMSSSSSPVKPLNQATVRQILEAAREDVDHLFNKTEPSLATRAATKAGTVMLKFWGSNRSAKELSYSALVSQIASQQLVSRGASREQLEKAQLKGSALAEICPQNAIEECIPGKYRSYSGHCNNVRHALWGANLQPMQRMGRAAYRDGIAIPRGTSRHDGLPSGFEVSSLFGRPERVHGSCSLFTTAWASFIYDDLSLAGNSHLTRGTSRYFTTVQPPPVPCCDDEVEHPDCFPIKNQDREDEKCLPYARTLAAPRENCSLGPREQSNTRCFRTGHPRANQLPTLAALYALWMRQHNHIADGLKRVNPHWGDEKLFQEARRVVVAQLQHITYNEMLPMLVGKEGLRRNGLALRHRGYDSDYDMDVDPTVLNEFAAAIGQFFYTLHPPTVQYLDEHGDVAREDDLRQAFNNPSQLHSRGALDGVVRFLAQRQINEPGLQMADAMRHNFLGVKGLDLAAIIIQMGRDHGLASYSKWRKWCGLSVPRDWRQFADEVQNVTLVDALAQVYRRVEDVDLFVGGLMESPVKGALLGPTFGCITTRQFYNTRRGDRFWYENFFVPSAFTIEQLEELRKTTLARIVCDNSEPGLQMQPHLFNVPDQWGNCLVDCNSTVIPKIDFSAWADEEPELKLPITKATLEKAIRLGYEQYERLEKAEKGRIAAQGNRGDLPAALLSHSLLMAPKKESLDIARTAGILSETTRILVDGSQLNPEERLPQSLDISTLKQLLPGVDVAKVVGNFTPFLGRDNPKREECLPEPLPCDHTTKYRTFSGWCNNLKFPKYGNAFGSMRRLLDPAYDDGFDHPRTKAKSGKTLPSARKISNVVHADAPNFHVKFTHMVMQFGQILDHDMMHSPISRGPGNTILNCSECDSYQKLSVHCFPIKIDQGDPFFPATYPDGRPRCMPFARSLLGQLTLGYRNQLNQLTSYLDASTIYGSTQCEANKLRLFSRGLLNFTNLGFNKEALPQGPQERDCRSILKDPKARCFEAGDERVNEQPGLAVIHTIFLREHNRMATELRKLNNFWSDEQLYQETRRIMIAKLQHIIFAEWLPVVLGCETMARYDLMPKKNGYYTEYDPHCDASITQEMSTSAFRFGHTLIRAMFPRMNAAFGNETEPVVLKDHFANPLPLYNKTVGHMESLLMGLVGAHSMAFDRHITDAVRNHLFAKPGGPLTGIDLPAVNIQRGRDHGVQPYNAYREICGFPRAHRFADLKDTMDKEAIEALEKVYESVDDIDLFPGLMSERPLKGALVGPMLACIIAEQMQRLKKCDRFYYENDQPSTRFTPGQLAEIRKSSLAAMFCQNSQWASQIQPNVFLMADELSNSPITCSEVPQVDLTEWVDRQWCVIGDRVVGRGKTARAMPCVTCTCTADGPECHPMIVEKCESLLDTYLLSDIATDTSCVIQCSKLLREQKGRL